MPAHPDPSLADLAVHLRQMTDRCVACALCTPHCPTYAHARCEAESPRGRIAMVQGLASGSLRLSAPGRAHLEHCLLCRNCERHCPAQVPFAQVMDGARQLLHHAPPASREPWSARLLRWCVRSPARLRCLQGLVGAYAASGLRRVTGWPGRRLCVWLPVAGGPSVHRQAYYPAHGASRGEVALFLGCVARILDQETLRATIRLLNRLGYGVHVPRGQGCCGALDLHSGRRAAARQAASRNLAAFAAQPELPILSTATGCTAQLAAYADLAPTAVPGIGGAAVGSQWQHFAARVTDVVAWLATCQWPEALAATRVPEGRLLIHEPCTQRNTLTLGGITARLLQRLPGLRWQALPTATGCCGAGGLHLLAQPAWAEALGRRYWADATAEMAHTPALGGVASNDILLTSNIGCRLQLTHVAGSGAGCPRVMHPVVLLERCLTAEKDPA